MNSKKYSQEQYEFYLSQTSNALDLPVPAYMTELSAGLDLYANVFDQEIILPNKIKLIATGIKIALPKNFEAQVRPRSGLALKHGISILNSPGTIDADYRGEIKIILINHGTKDFIIKRGDRIAQIIINKITRVNFKLVDKLDETKRNDQGFGHTG